MQSLTLAFRAREVHSREASAAPPLFGVLKSLTGMCCLSNSGCHDLSVLLRLGIYTYPSAIDLE